MKEKEVRARVEKYNGTWEDFTKWMEHQTCGLDPVTGEVDYYSWDVGRFVDGLKKGKSLDRQIQEIED